MQFFESNIRPVLADNCFKCHGPSKQRGGLRLDTRGDAMTGGDNGKAVVPGDAENSLLLQAVTHSNPDLKPMPPPPAKVVAETDRRPDAMGEDGRTVAGSGKDRRLRLDHSPRQV